MRLAKWIAAGLVAFGIFSLASAQDVSATAKTVSTGTGSSKGTSRVPVAPTTSSLLNFNNLFKTLFGTGNTKGTAPFQPVRPMMGTVDNPSKAIFSLGAESGVRTGNYVLPKPK